MAEKKKQEIRFAPNVPAVTVSRGTATGVSRIRVQADKSILKARKPPPVFPKLLPYVPPDVLMYDLFSAIQRRAWVRARKLCYELILCDPLRKNYRDLYQRIDEIIKVIDRRIRPQPVVFNTVGSVKSDDSDEDDELIVPQ